MTPKENMLRVIKHDHPEWVPDGPEALHMVSPPIIERHSGNGYDCFNCHWSLEPGAEGGSYPTHGGHPIKDLHKWREHVSVPDLNELDWASIADEAKKIDREANLTIGFFEMGLFERSYLLLGMEAALMAYLTEPEIMFELCGVIADYKIKLIERTDDILKLDIVWYGDDWGTQNALFMPPDIWRRVIKPHTKRIYDALHKRNILVYQHSCGRIEEIFGDMVENGADIWDPCQPCNNLPALKKIFGGKITFVGGIDSQFVLTRPDLTTDDIRSEVRRMIDAMAEGGGYMAAPSHGVPYRQDIIDAMHDEIRTYGREFYRKP